MQHQVDRRESDTHLERLVEDAVRRAFENMFEMLGTDVSTSEGRKEFRADLEFARDARTGTATVRKTAVVAAIGTFVTGAAFGLWSWITWLLAHTPAAGK